MKPRELTADEAERHAVAEKPVFDVANDNRELPRLVDRCGEWQPPKRHVRGGKVLWRAGDGPSDAHRIRAGQAWYSSHRYSGQLVADNQNWPLAKFLRAEGHDRHQRLAERYRDLFDAAHDPIELVGKDMADNIYLMSRTDLDESTGRLVDKGTKRVTGRNARLDVAATRAVVADPDKTKRRAKPIPKRWQGDWPLIHKIDAQRELARAQQALGWLREPFEAAVVGGETLEAIGRSHGVGNPAGAKGAGRALVFLGFDAIEQHWQRERIAA